MENPTVITPIIQRPPTDDRRKSCPLCGSEFVELRGLVRCCRCHFILCEGCEADLAEAGLIFGS